MPAADKRRAVLKWLSPLEPRERHQAIGMDRATRVELVSSYKLVYWRNQSGDGLLSLFDFDMEIPALERLILAIWRLPQRTWVRLNSINNSSFVTDRLCGKVDAGVWLWHVCTSTVHALVVYDTRAETGKL